YIHIPFCRSRCTYCTFNTYTGLSGLFDSYVDALCKEIAWLGARYARSEVHTIYFGGGTPSVLPIYHVDKIITSVHKHFVVTADVEISFEANPEPEFVDKRYLAGLLQAGITRLSFGAQSALPADLRLFNRRHLWSDVIEVVESARAVGIYNVSLDLIYGAPGQSIAGWHDTLAQALALNPTHLSLYSLGLEQGAPLTRWVDTGRVEALEDDLVATMYDYASDVLEQHGLLQYEISNWAYAGNECQHNLQYWRRQPYIGSGAGAHSFIDPIRYMVVKDPQEYIQRWQRGMSDNDGNLSISDELWPYLPPVVDPPSIEVLSEDEACAETMFLGLRLLQEGVSMKAFQARFGQSIDEIYSDELRLLVNKGQIIKTNNRIILPKNMRLIANQAFESFV
ncbi:radical SAM family heme chaperone HemW, partial [Chloroflexota bacterium]